MKRHGIHIENNPAALDSAIAAVMASNLTPAQSALVIQSLRLTRAIVAKAMEKTATR
jgi:hypothetical protein